MNDYASTPIWAAPPLAADTDDFLSAIERGFPVRLIATFKLQSCSPGEPLSEVLEDPRLAAFDYVPVDEGGRIIGLIERAKLAQLSWANSGISVRAKMLYLDESVLISADAGILTFIETAHASPCRLVLDRESISGIVTISDLQRLPVRPVLFVLVTHVELLMAQVIRDAGIPENAWLKWLNDGRRDELDRKWRELSEGNLAIDKLSATQFCDKRDILAKILRENISSGRLKKEMRGIEWLRNSVAHAGDYALTPETARRTIAAVQLCKQWIGRLQEIRAEFLEDSRRGGG